MQPDQLSSPVRVDGHGTIANKVALGIGVIGLIAAAILWTNREWEFAVVCVVIATPMLLIALGIALRRFRRRAWVQVSDDGFVYGNRDGERQYRDDQVIGVNLVSKPNYRQGELKSYTNDVQLKVAGAPQPIRIKTTTKLADVDPLSNFVARTIENYQLRAEEALDAGARLSGKGWSLGNEDITVEGTDSIRVANRDLVAMETVDGLHKIWRKEQDEPFLSVPTKSENAFLLTLLLGPKIAEQEGNREIDLSQPGLGRLIFRRACGRIGRSFGWLFVLLAFPAIPLFVAGAAGGNPNLMAAGAINFIVSPLTLLLGLALLRAEFRCHERGVFRRLLLKGRELRFEHVESFKYAATKQYYNGGYVGTALEVVFFPKPGSGKKKLRYSRMVQNADEALDGLRDHITMILMPMLGQTLASTGSLQWMPNLRITHEGFHYRPKGFVSRKKEEQFIGFDDVYAMDVQEGTFHVWTHGKDKSVIRESTSEPNFYPGYLLATQVYSAARRGDTRVT